MASKATVAVQMERLKLKREELDLRIKKDEVAKKLAETRSKLRSNGGRIR